MRPDLLPIEHRCHCRVEDQEGRKGRRPPIRIVAATAHALQQTGLLASSTPFQTYRCPTCKGEIILTAGDCHLTPLRPDQ